MQQTAEVPLFLLDLALPGRELSQGRVVGGELQGGAVAGQHQQQHQHRDAGQ